MKEGNLTLEQLAAFHFKVETFQPYVRDLSSLRALTHDGSEVPPLVLGPMSPPFAQTSAGQNVEVLTKDLYKVLRDTRTISGEKIVSRSFARKHGL